MSSARVVRCWVKSRNERNPYLMLPALWVGTHERLPQTMRRKAGMTSNHHGPYILGYTRATMVVTESSQLREQARIYKDDHSSDRSLQLDSVKLESLVIGYQP